MLDVGDLRVRLGGPEDQATVLQLFDDAVAWLVARGQTGQWGSEPFSTWPEGRARVRELVSGGGLRIAERMGEPVGALVVGSAPGYAPAVGRPELYIELLLTARRYAGQNIGSRLVEVAAAEARAMGAELIRVDCWSGAPGLVGWYERQGFSRCGSFDVDGWTGQLFTMDVRRDP